MSSVSEGAKVRSEWVITRYKDHDAYLRGEPTTVVDANGVELPAVSRVSGNLLLNEGIGLALDLIIGAGGTPYNNANTRLGVGDSTTAAAATQTALQAATNKAWVGMEAGYPSRSAQTVTWRAVFGTSAANFDWREFTVVNATDDTGTNLNRKVDTQGTKAAGQTWTLDLQITLS